MPLFRRPQADVVVVAVRYEEPGKIRWVRAFERRGPTWSDWKIIHREDLVARIRSGEKVVAGERIKFEAGTFNYGEALRVEDKNGAPVVVSGHGAGSSDDLGAVPIV